MDSPQYTAFTGQQAYDASEQSICMAMSADEQQPMVMMAPQMQPIPGVCPVSTLHTHPASHSVRVVLSEYSTRRLSDVCTA